MQLLFVALAAFALAPEEESPPPPTVWEFLIVKYDTDLDGRISRAEYLRSEETWTRLDRDGNGFLEASEFEGRTRRSARSGGSERGENKRGAQAAGDADAPRPAAPKVGEPAPDFDLAVLRRPVRATAGTEPAQPQQGDKQPLTVKLSGFAGKRPVALIFGSYT